MRAPKIWKICVIGDSAVGKTSFIRRFVYDSFEPEVERTMESKAYRKKLDGATLLIWDISVYEKNIKAVLSSAKGIIIMGDLTRKATLDTMAEIANFLDGHRAEKIFIANKSDLKYMAQFWKDEMEEISSAFGIPYSFSSAKTGEGVNDAFSKLIEGIS